jgi:prepilin-type N-terminal cleavage/methylation domain-containing protein
VNRLHIRPRPRSRRGFTIVEVAIALAILGVLLSLALPRY